ncbi:MAG: glycosyltransferase family 4 protein [Candidatus ainarchaeum sp.]|nr:glycosyltransferase family 4 protein [Candidatus ainarchaeum sp.]
MRILLIGSKEWPFHSGAGFEKKPSGGIEIHVDKLSRFLAKNNQNIFIITRLFPNQSKYETTGKIKVWRVPFINNTFLRNLSFNFLAYFKAKEIIKAEKIDLIHAHGQVGGFFGALLKNKFNVPLVYTPHGLPRGWFFPIKKFLYFLNDFAIKRASKVLFVSPISRTEMLQKYPKLNNKLMTNAIDLGDFNKTNKTWKEIRFVFMGRLEEVKGLRILFEAYTKLSKEYNVKLNIGGDGLLKSELEKFVVVNKTKNVAFFGWVKDMPSFLMNNDVFVLPSFETGQPVALLEAMAAGKIIITSLPYVENEKTGLKVKMGNSDDLYKKMVYVCNNFKSCEKLAVSAKIKAKDFDWNIVIKDFIKEYNLILKSGISKLGKK